MISVIIPVYNGEDTILRAVDSVKNQTRIDLIREILIINDGSTDSTTALLKDYIIENESLPIKLITQENKGVSTARNNGLKLASSEWVSFLDSDDGWSSEKIEIQVGLINNNKDIDFLGGNENETKMKILFRSIDDLYKANIKDLCLKTFPSTSTAIFKKKIVEKIGYFDEHQQYGEDMNYFYKICLNFNYYYYHSPRRIELYNSDTDRAKHTGLSSNLIGMHKGNVKNIRELRDGKHISLSFYIFLRVFYSIKLVRRYILWKIVN